MKEEMQAINQRLDQMQGVLLAQGVLLTAVAQDLRRRDWTRLLEMDALIEDQEHELRHSSASDQTLYAFQKTISKFRQSLDPSESKNQAA